MGGIFKFTMSNITDYLFEKGKGIIERKPEVTDGRYEMADDGGVELCVGELLYGLIRAIKPQAVLSTGIYTGVSDMYIGQALLDNGFGTSDALEFEPKHIERAKKLWMQVGVDKVINEHLTSSLEFTPNRNYDFMFLDTEPQIRLHELVKFFPYLNLGGYFGIHDLHRHMGQNVYNPDHPDMPHWPWGEIPQQIKQWVREDKLRVIHFPSPRGLTFMYKTNPEDYKW